MGCRVAGICLVSIAAAGCQRAAPPDELFPLAAGHRWVYRVTTQTEDDNNKVEQRMTLTFTTLGAERIADDDDEPAWHRRGDDGMDYWHRADASGIYRVASRTMLDPAPSRDTPRRYVLKAPYAVGTQWQAMTTAYVLARRFDFPKEVRYVYQPVAMSYRIEAVGEALQTPAGRYSDCLRVRGNASLRVYADPLNGWSDLPLTTLEWYCRGVGLVRLERSEPVRNAFMTGGSRTLELVSFR
jgi:hypothetical protein